MAEPSLRGGQHGRLSQNVRMSRGCYGDLHSMDGSLWDTSVTFSSDNQSSAQLSGHGAAVVPSPGSATSSGDQQGQVSMEQPRRPHSTSSSDEWLQKQAGSSSTSRNSSHHSSSSKSNPESPGGSHDSNGSRLTGDSVPSSQAASFAKAESVAMDRPTEGAEHATEDVSPQCSSKPASSEAQSTESVGVASLSAGVAPQMPSPSQASSADSQGTCQSAEPGHDSCVVSGLDQQGAGTAPVQTAEGSTQSNDSSQVAARAFLPRSASMDVEVGSLGGDWAQDAQTLGLGTPGTYATSAELATQLASPSATAPLGAAAEGSAISSNQSEVEQKPHESNTGTSPSFELECGARQADSGDTPSTPQFQIPGGMAGSPQEQATPQLTMLGRAAHAPTAVPLQSLASHPSIESDAATPLPRVLPQPIQVAEAVTSKVQIPVGRLHADGSSQKPPQVLPSAAQAQAAAAREVVQAPDASHAGDLMSPPTVCTPVMPRGHPFDKPRAASKRAANQPAEPSLAMEMAQHPATGKPAIGQIAGGNASKAPSVFLTTPPPPTAPKVSSRTRKRSPRSSSSAADQPTASLTEPQSLVGQMQGKPDSHLVTLDA